jgi:hypothetical protein
VSEAALIPRSHPLPPALLAAQQEVAARPGDHRPVVAVQQAANEGAKHSAALPVNKRMPPDGEERVDQEHNHHEHD